MYTRSIMKRQIITIVGNLGSGKSSTSKKVAGALGYKHYSAGDFMRRMAKERDMSLDELVTLAKKDATIDSTIDGYIRDTAKKEDHFVMDSRIAFHWIPNSFKVFLTLDPHIAAERIYKQITEEGRVSENASSAEEVYQKLVVRFEAEKHRYQNYYNIDSTNLSQFDLVIDTSKHNLEEVVTLVLEAYNEWKNQK